MTNKYTFVFNDMTNEYHKFSAILSSTVAKKKKKKLSSTF